MHLQQPERRVVGKLCISVVTDSDHGWSHVLGLWTVLLKSRVSGFCWVGRVKGIHTYKVGNKDEQQGGEGFKKICILDFFVVLDFFGGTIEQKIIALVVAKWEKGRGIVYNKTCRCTVPLDIHSSATYLLCLGFTTQYMWGPLYQQSSKRWECYQHPPQLSE